MRLSFSFPAFLLNRAYHLANWDFNDTVSELNSLSKKSYQGSTLIMQLLLDNLTPWTSSDNDEAEEPRSESQRGAHM